MSAWVVHKFGGTSLANANRYRRAAEIVRTTGGERTAVVVSAIAGVTDSLLRAVHEAAAQSESFLEHLRAARDLNLDLATDLLGDGAVAVAEAIRSDASDLEGVLRSVRLTRTASEQTADFVSGYGELWSAQLLQAHLASCDEDVAWMDAREVLVVRKAGPGPAVQWDETSELLKRWRSHHAADTIVITGYVACDPDGVPVSLERNGSDFSASIFAKLLGAETLTIWTDVDGVMSADPRLVPEAVLLPHLSYEEAAELSYFGAAVLHPHTMAPAIASGIPIHIRNARHPDRPGTILSSGRSVVAGEHEAAIRGFSASGPMALLNLEGVGMVGVPGVAQRLFGALREVGVSVVLISQAGSEHSICVALPIADAETAEAAVRRAFHAELHEGQVQTVEVDGPYRILAAVGDGMVRTAGVSGRFFRALGAAGVNVRAIAQGASERNISAVVADADATRALRAVHAGFYLSDQTLSVGLLGPGRIGSELLRQIRAEAAKLHERFRIDVRVRGIMRSTKMILHDQGIDLTRWEESLETEGEPADLKRFTAHVHANHLPHAVIVDCTASGELNDAYPGWLGSGVHVVTANKQATSASLELFRRIREPRTGHRAHYFGSATVGAGLPVIETLRDLIRTGDRVIRVEGVLSGTLSYIFNSLARDLPLSAVVADAYRRGYTEPDPRDDLSGTDVARKALILAREMGLPLQPSDIDVETLVPTDLRSTGGAEAFIEALSSYDEEMENRRLVAEQAGEVLRYVAVIDGGRAAVRLQGYSESHPFARIQSADNIIAFTTERYSTLPLIIQGPGAGPAVTAGGVFSDILRLATYLGPPG